MAAYSGYASIAAYISGSFSYAETEANGFISRGSSPEELSNKAVTATESPQLSNRPIIPIEHLLW